VPRRRYDSFGPYLSSAKSDSQTSETAEALEEQTIVNTRYDLSRPGKYAIQVQLANDPRTFIEVPRKFRYGSQGLELDDKVNGASRATVKSNRVTLTIEPAPQP
jgi:hypothetical protein